MNDANFGVVENIWYTYNNPPDKPIVYTFLLCFFSETHGPLQKALRFRKANIKEKIIC